MSTTTERHTAHDQDTLKWRIDHLRHGGFNKRNANLLAESNIDYRYAIQVLQNACDKGLSEEFVMALIYDDGA